jgi:hypothetical protein
MQAVSIVSESPLQQSQLPFPASPDPVFLPGACLTFSSRVLPILVLYQQEIRLQDYESFVLPLLLLLFRHFPVHPLWQSHVEWDVLFAQRSGWVQSQWLVQRYEKTLSSLTSHTLVLAGHQSSHDFETGVPGPECAHVPGNLMPKQLTT